VLGRDQPGAAGSGNTATQDDSGATGGRGKTTTRHDAGATAGSGPLRNPNCPAAIPIEGAPCPVGTECEYGTANAPVYCTAIATCSDAPNGWSVAPPPPECVVRSPECPSTFQSAAGAPCKVPSSSQCYYEDGKCTCATACFATAQPSWSCVPWEIGCSSPHPVIGDACQPGSVCGGGCGTSAGGPRECKNGFWTFGTEPPCLSCPTQ
jgi:hypothetical protein